MQNRGNSIEAVTAILRTSTAADGGAGIPALRSLAESIVSAVEECEAGSSVEGAVLNTWELDNFQRSEVFG